MDNNYFILYVSGKKSIQIYYFTSTTRHAKSLYYPTCLLVKASNYSKVNYLLSLLRKLSHSSTQHKLYLGKEVYKAQIAFKLNQPYIQN